MAKMLKTAVLSLTGALLLTGEPALFAWQDGHSRPAGPRRAERPKGPRHHATETAKPDDKPARVADPRYPVNPPDLISVKVLEALPGRPISGERLVRPDGTMTLGYYGDVFVAGLTLPEIKTRVIEHLQQFLSDEQLGLVGPGGERVPPEKSLAVFVDVAAYNSQVYYVQGDVAAPGRLPVTGRETVLDAINYAGGLAPRSPESPKDIHLVRPRPGQSSQVLDIDYDAILSGDESTNYPLEPNDRIIVRCRPQSSEPDGDMSDDDPETIIRMLDLRLKGVEAKLDRLLQILEEKP